MKDGVMRWLFVLLLSVAIVFWFLFRGESEVNAGNINLTASQQAMADLIDSIAGEQGYSNSAFLKGLALEESSLNPLAHSNRNSYGLFQIFHASNFSWLRWAGYRDTDVDRLYDPTFNTKLAIRVIRYFESRGFVFPDQADIYNVGETEWAKKVRNASYQKNVQAYTNYFSA